MNGLFIAIEGTDGSGKGTQTELLTNRFLREGHRVETSSFPQYGKKSAGLIEDYLNGHYGPPDDLDPRIASHFYALDRFDKSFELKKILASGAVLLLDRYVDSNAGHQGGKIADEKARIEFINWLYTLEYDTLGCPKPDMTIILCVPAEKCSELVLKKQARAYIQNGKKQDDLESNLEHQKRSEASFRWLATQHPTTHFLIECVEDGELLRPEVIHEKVWGALQSVLSIACLPVGRE